VDNYEFTLIVQDMEKVRAVRSGGEEISGTLNFDELRLDTIKIFEDLLSESRIKRRRELEVLGRLLYEGLFADQVGNYFEQALQEAQKAGQHLCVRLRFQKAADELSRLPWEYLYRSGTDTSRGFWLSTNVNLVLVRFMPLASSSTSPKPTESLLRTLIVVSEPADLQPVAAESVIEAIEKLAETTHPIEIYKLDKPTIKNFQEKLQETKPHVLHFIGHGRYKMAEKQAEIALLKPDERSVEWCPDKTFAEYFQPVDSNPRLVLLHLCQAALSDPDSSTFIANFSQLAPQLILANIQAVIAMQHPILNPDAISFCRAIYRKLAEGESPDDAVQYGRMQIVSGNPNAYNSRVFGTPVLYIHSSDGIIQRMGVTSELKPSRSM
jgi:hypothetical protein